MIDIDLDAIRKRDTGWTDRQPLRESAGRDRRALLAYIDSLDAILDEIDTDVKLMRKKLREALLPQEPDALQALEAARAGRKHRKRDDVT